MSPRRRRRALDHQRRHPYPRIEAELGFLDLRFPQRSSVTLTYEITEFPEIRGNSPRIIEKALDGIRVEGLRAFDLTSVEHVLLALHANQRGPDTRRRSHELQGPLRVRAQPERAPQLVGQPLRELTLEQRSRSHHIDPELLRRFQ